MGSFHRRRVNAFTTQSAQQRIQPTHTTQLVISSARNAVAETITDANATPSSSARISPRPPRPSIDCHAWKRT